MQKKNIITIIIVIALIAAGVGAWFAWKSYKHSNSPEGFVEKLNATLLAKDLETLANMVDFRIITEDMALKILASPMPSEKNSPKSKNATELAEVIHKAFIDNINNAEETPPPKDPLAPLLPIPHDFAKQISGKAVLLNKSGNSATISIPFHHPQVEKDFQLQFLIKEAPDWKIVEFVNFYQLLQSYIQEEMELEKQRKRVFKAKRAEDKTAISKQFRIDNCTAFVHRPSGQRNDLLAIRIKGYNQGPFTIRNMNYETVIIAQSPEGEISYSQSVNSAARILVGTFVEESLSIDLDANKKQTAILTQAGQLRCEAKVRLMTLDNGKVLYIDPEGSAAKQKLQ